LIAPAFLQHGENVCPLYIFERTGSGFRDRQAQRKILLANLRFLGHHHRPFDSILKLTHVAGPLVSI
jgi:hypothetical protein